MLVQELSADHSRKAVLDGRARSRTHQTWCARLTVFEDQVPHQRHRSSDMV